MYVGSAMNENPDSECLERQLQPLLSQVPTVYGNAIPISQSQRIVVSYFKSCQPFVILCLGSLERHRSHLSDLSSQLFRETLDYRFINNPAVS